MFLPVKMVMNSQRLVWDCGKETGWAAREGVERGVSGRELNRLEGRLGRALRRPARHCKPDSSTRQCLLFGFDVFLF